MAKRVTIHMTDATADLVAVRSSGSRSATIRRMVTRYARLCAGHLPSLTREDWGTVAAALRGVDVDPIWTVGHYVAAALAPGTELTGGGVSDRLAECTLAECTAVVDLVERYWVAVDGGAAVESPLEMI